MLERKNALINWLQQVLTTSDFILQPLAGDASFRCYYRLHYQQTTRIVMDAPPDKECSNTFIKITKILQEHGVHVPIIYAENSRLGFLLLEDLGDNALLAHLKKDSRQQAYQGAFAELLKIQRCPTSALPAFDAAFMHQEMERFKTWFLQAYLQKNLKAEEEQLLANTFQYLSDAILKQPQVFIHRDYHSRNIMVDKDQRMIVIDFQDAMRGPFTYDLVSLLKDCYIHWPREQVLVWLSDYYYQSPIAQQSPLADFIKAFDFCGLQRHLKVCGNFCRLYLRDNKKNYLQDLPLTIAYLLEGLALYPEFNAFLKFMQGIQLP